VAVVIDDLGMDDDDCLDLPPELRLARIERLIEKLDEGMAELLASLATARDERRILRQQAEALAARLDRLERGAGGA
jgi:hypothetical protein